MLMLPCLLPRYMYIYAWPTLILSIYAFCAHYIGKSVYGVKGTCVLQSLPGFDLIDDNPIDYMHCVVLGVV